MPQIDFSQLSIAGYVNQESPAELLYYLAGRVQTLRNEGMTVTNVPQAVEDIIDARQHGRYADYNRMFRQREIIKAGNRKMRRAAAALARHQYSRRAK